MASILTLAVLRVTFITYTRTCFTIYYFSFFFFAWRLFGPSINFSNVLLYYYYPMFSFLFTNVHLCFLSVLLITNFGRSRGFPTTKGPFGSSGFKTGACQTPQSDFKIALFVGSEQALAHIRVRGVFCIPLLTF